MSIKWLSRTLGSAVWHVDDHASAVQNTYGTRQHNQSSIFGKVNKIIYNNIHIRPECLAHRNRLNLSTLYDDRCLRVHPKVFSKHFALVSSKNHPALTSVRFPIFLAFPATGTENFGRSITRAKKRSYSNSPEETAAEEDRLAQFDFNMSQLTLCRYSYASNVKPN